MGKIITERLGKATQKVCRYFASTKDEANKLYNDAIDIAQKDDAFHTRDISGKGMFLYLYVKNNVCKCKKQPKDFKTEIYSYKRTMFKHAMSKLHDTEEAQEVVSTAFHKALEYHTKRECGWESKNSYNYDTELSTWLCRIVKNIIIDNSRACRNRDKSEMPAEVTDKTTTNNNTEFNILIAMLKKGLTDKEYKIIFMRYEGYKDREIAEKTGFSNSAIAKAKVRAKEIMRGYSVK